MTDTPIIDAAAKAIMECDEDSAWDSIASADCRNAAIAALRAALPWDLPAERLEAMARGMTTIAGWRPMPLSESERRMHVLAAYRADPIMRELYPEKFK